jgi:hypothetical protein
LVVERSYLGGVSPVKALAFGARHVADVGRMQIPVTKMPGPSAANRRSHRTMIVLPDRVIDLADRCRRLQTPLAAAMSYHRMRYTVGEETRRPKRESG